MDLDDLETLDAPTPAERPFHLLDEHEKAIPDEESHAELSDANRRAKELGRKVIVVKRLPDGASVHMSYTGPGGWQGPKSKPQTHPAYGIPPRRKHTEG